MSNAPDKYLTWAPEWLQDIIVLIGLISFGAWIIFLFGEIKYIARAGKKSPDPLEDLKKARWYIDHEIERISSK